VLKHIALKYHLSSVATLTTEFQAASRSNVSTITVRLFMKWVSISEQQQTSLRSICAMPSIGWRGVKTLEQRNDTFSGMMNLALPSGSPTNLGLADARRMLSAPMHIANCKVWWMRNNGLGLFFMVRARPLISGEGKS
jgi:hypothetical protein